MGNQQACASGVSIDPQLVGLSSAQGALVLTNYHVIADMGNQPPLQLNGKGEVYNAQILRQSPQFDLALLWVPKAQFPIAALADASPDRGTAVRAIGFPNNQPLTIKDSSLLGKTQNCLAIAPCLALQQGTITFGNSGGPLEANGKVIGITQGEVVDEIAIPVEQIRQFLSGQAPAGRPQFNPDFPSQQVPRNRRPRYQPDFPPMQEPPYFPPDAPPGYPMY
jgi:S1-C subfamily serine protease